MKMRNLASDVVEVEPNRDQENHTAITMVLEVNTNHHNVQD